jgi:hypothetical protein
MHLVDDIGFGYSEGLVCTSFTVTLGYSPGAYSREFLQQIIFWEGRKSSRYRLTVYSGMIVNLVLPLSSPLTRPGLGKETA